MSIITNGKQGVAISSKAATQSKDVPWSEPPPLEQFNWLIYLTYACGETNICKDLIDEEIKKSAGRNEYAYYQKGIILKNEKKAQEALESFQICHKLNSVNVEYIKQVANCLFLLRKYKLALEAYLEAEKSTEKPDWEICHKLGECLYTVGELGSSKDYARRAVQLGKQEASYALLIKVLIADNDLRSAIAVSNAALENCPDSIDMLTESGVLYLRTGQIQHAFERLSSALALDPNSVKALLGVGSIIQSHEEFDVALSKYKLAVNFQPDSVALWNNIGMCFYGKQKYVASVSCLKRALWHSALSWRVLYNLGLVHLSTRQPASAFNFLCAAVNLRPDHAHAFMLLGCALMDLDDNENGSRALRQAATLAPEDGMVLATAALACHRAGDASAAAAATAAAINLLEAAPNTDSETDMEVKELVQQLLALYPPELAEAQEPETESPGDDATAEEEIRTEADEQERQLDADENRYLMPSAHMESFYEKDEEEETLKTFLK